jgi:hypothetical protein
MKNIYISNNIYLRNILDINFYYNILLLLGNNILILNYFNYNIYIL